VRYGWPEVIAVDNGPEFTSEALDQWAWARGVRLHFIQRGKPLRNAFAQSFNGKVRDECPNENWFTGLGHARDVVAAWHRDYNEVRPHRSLSGMMPAEYDRRLASGSTLRSPSKESHPRTRPNGMGTEPGQGPVLA
jgi:putative transposase